MKIFTISLGLAICCWISLATAQEETIIIPMIYEENAMANVITVSQSGGEFTDIQSAIDSIEPGSATFQSPYVIMIGPGKYNVTQTIVVPDFIHIRGSGRQLTFLSGNIINASLGGPLGVISGGNNSIQDLAVTNSPDAQSGDNVIAIHNFRQINNVGAFAQHETVDATTGDFYAIYSNDVDGTTVNNSRVLSWYGNIVQGIHSTNKLVAKNLDVSALDGVDSVGIAGPEPATFNKMEIFDSIIWGDTWSLVVNNALSRVVNVGVSGNIDDQAGSDQNCLNVYDSDSLSIVPAC